MHDRHGRNAHRCALSFLSRLYELRLAQVGCMMVHHRDDNPMDDLVRRSGLRYREYDRGPVARFFRNDGTPFDLTRCKRLENIFYNILDEQTSARAAEGNVDEKESVGEFVRQRVREIIEDEEERRCCELMLKRAAAYYGAPIDDIALRWYGFEQGAVFC